MRGFIDRTAGNVGCPPGYLLGTGVCGHRLVRSLGEGRRVIDRGDVDHNVRGSRLLGAARSGVPLVVRFNPQSHRAGVVQCGGKIQITAADEIVYPRNRSGQSQSGSRAADAYSAAGRCRQGALIHCKNSHHIVCPRVNVSNGNTSYWGCHILNDGNRRRHGNRRRIVDVFHINGDILTGIISSVRSLDGEGKAGSIFVVNGVGIIHAYRAAGGIKGKGATGVAAGNGKGHRVVVAGIGDGTYCSTVGRCFAYRKNLAGGNDRSDVPHADGDGLLADIVDGPTVVGTDGQGVTAGRFIIQCRLAGGTEGNLTGRCVNSKVTLAGSARYAVGQVGIIAAAVSVVGLDIVQYGIIRLDGFRYAESGGRGKHRGQVASLGIGDGKGIQSQVGDVAVAGDLHLKGSQTSHSA